MPKSSVFVRLNWPSKSSETSQEEIESPPCQDIPKAQSLQTEGRKSAGCQKGVQVEEKPIQKSSPSGEDNDCLQAKSKTKSKEEVIEKEILDKHSNNKSSESPSRITKECKARSSYKQGTPVLDTSHSLDSPLWSGTKQAKDFDGFKAADNIISSQNKVSDGTSKETNGNGKAQRQKCKTKSKNPGKGRKITRSLSASCVSVSTNTDPKDFLELAQACLTSATLPSRRRVKEEQNGNEKSEKPSESSSLQKDSEIVDTESSFESSTKNVSLNIVETVAEPSLQDQNAVTGEDEAATNKDVKSQNSQNDNLIVTQVDINKSNVVLTETNQDFEKGYIELPSYVPKEDKNIKKYEVPDDEAVSLLPLHHTFIVGEMSNSEYLQPNYFYKNTPQLTGNLVTEEQIPVRLNSVSPVRDDRIPVNVSPAETSASGSVYPTDLSDIPPVVLPSYNQANFVKPTFHAPDMQEDKPKLIYPHEQSCDFTEAYDGTGRGYPNLRGVISNNESDCVRYPMHWSPVPERVASPQRRQKLDKDISAESCPDVVLQTLEGEGTLQQNKTLKKTVTFLLPPEHWDSLISLRESNIGGYPQSGYAELDGALLPPNGQDPYRNTPSPGLHGIPQDQYVRWRNPDLHEVIDFLSNPNNVVKANAAAYLQHLCYMDDPTKQKTRILGGIPPLVALLSHDLPELHRNACGALRNLSYGRQNDENKRAIRDATGIPALVRLLRKTPDNEVKELVTGILWNLSSCEDLKHNIIDDALTVIVSHVIIPCSGWDGGDVERDPNVDVWWSTVFKNASGVLRNISSAGEYARTKLRQCNGLVDSLLTVIKSAIQGSSHDNKSVENCVCILRNLSYRCQEVEDPNYDKNQPPTQSRATATAKGDNLGCFGGSRKKKEAVGGAVKETSTGQRTTGPRTEPLRGMELLWQPDVVVSSYLALLSDCSNPETLEAAAGALQNLAACYWQPSIDVRAAVRKEKGLPILVELLRMEVDRVVCAVATALRNLAIDQRNKELIGKYAMRDLVQKLPSGNTHDSGTSDETIAAVLATLNEVIKKSAEFSRSLLDVGGVERLVNMTRHRGRYSVRVVKFASQVLFSMWGHQELREVYKKAGWKEQDFVSKSVAARNAAGGGANSPTANNTLNRPMASQGGTRYEDRTIQRGQGKAHHQYNRGEEVPMANMGYSGDGGVVPPAGGVRLYPPMQGKPGEPVYAKVNRDKKRNRQYDGMGPQYGTLGGADDWGGPVYSGSPTASPNFNNSPIMNNNNSNANNNNGILLENTADGQAGDSWV